MRSTIEELLEKINEDGWWLSGMYQNGKDSWNVSLRKMFDFSSAYGTGETARNALIRAWKDAKGRSAPVDWDKLRVVGTCSVCGKPQYQTSSGRVCREGHGGAPTKEDSEEKVVRRRPERA